jgi:hypothetical protein
LERTRERITTMNTYTVWVGGIEINDYYLTIEQAKNMEHIYIAQGYEDVIIEKKGQQQ